MAEHLKSCPALHCIKCDRQFMRQDKFNSHVNTCKGKMKTCRLCKKSFKTGRELLEHLDTCGKFLCLTCDQEFPTKKELNEHKSVHAKRGNGINRRRNPEVFHCRFKDCSMEFKNRAELYAHKVDVHYDPDRVKQWPLPYPWGDDEEMRQTLERARNYIFKDHVHTNIHSAYNFPLTGEDWHTDLCQALGTVRDATSDVVKSNITLGLLLKKKDTDELRYFTPGDNFPLFDHPYQINRFSDWGDLIEKASITNITQSVNRNRPDTKWELVMVTNANVDVYYANVNMGMGSVPDYINWLHCVHNLVYNSNGKPFNDKKCAARALAFHHLSQNNPNISKSPKPVSDAALSALTDELHEQWGLNGVQTTQLPEFERCFDIDVDVFTLLRDNTAIPIYLSKGKRGPNRKITLNLYKDHLSYVSHTKAYLLKFSCDGCGRHFDKLSNLKRHRGLCTRVSLKMFNFDHYKPSQSIFEKLECEDIYVPESDRKYGWFATFDCEAYQEDTPPQSGGTQWVKKHEVISLSVASNVHNTVGGDIEFDYRAPKCFKGKDPQLLINQAVNYIKSISLAAGELAKRKWSSVIEDIDKKLEDCVDVKEAVKDRDFEGDEVDEDLFSDDEEDDEVDECTLPIASKNKDEDKKKPKDTVMERIKRLKGAFIKDYCCTLPVLGFNSSNYDINLIKPHLFPALGIGQVILNPRVKEQTNVHEIPDSDKPLAYDPDSFVIKKNNSYTAISANGMKFIDVTNFQVPGLSYAKFLKAYHINESKSFLPYEWMTGPDCLDHHELPPYRAFYSTIKGKNVLEEGDRTLGLKRYNELKLFWEERGWTCFGDYLDYFNDIEESKSFIPSEWMTASDRSAYSEMPPYEAYEVKGKNVLEEGDRTLGLKRYDELKQLWKEKGWTCFGDYLEYYNNLDVGPFVDAVEKMLDFYFARGIDVLKVAVSIPGIARRMLFDTARKQNESFASILSKDEDLYHILKRNIVGGPSIIFHREHGAGQTLLYDKEGNVCAIIVGYDANALYLWALDQNMPCGGYVRRFGPDFAPVQRLYRRDMYDWMDYMALTTKRKIWHGRNHGEVKKGKFKLDGFSRDWLVAYEFDGCYFHGCDICYKNKVEGTEPETIDADTGIEPVNVPENPKKSREQILKERREYTEAKKEYLKKKKIDLISITECQYKAMVNAAKKAPRYSPEDIKRDPSKTNLYDFVESRLPPFFRAHRFGPRTEQTILNAVKSGLLYGMVEVDIKVPDHLYEKFSEMSPLFHTVDVPVEDIGEHMKNYLKEHEMSTKPRRLLIGGMEAEKIMLHSELLKWYLEKGLVVSKVHQVVEFRPERVFRPFVQQVSEARRAGDADPAMKPVADGVKLIGNSAYGSVIMDKEKHQNTRYVTDEGYAQQLVNNARFKSMGELSDKLYEVSMSKSRVQCDLPIQLGYTILQLAKLKMLQFYYDFVQNRCAPQSFQMCEMDTDSCYMALTGPDIESVMKNDDLRETFHKTLRVDHCNDSEYGPDQGHFFPRECCTKHTTYDSRTPGLFKLEASGIEMISLCSKTYSLKTAEGKCKFSSKGLNKRALSDPHATFKEVLETGKSASGTNYGIRTHKNHVYTYQQDRKAISYFYCKRQVMNDGRTTRPLPTLLKVWPDRTLDIVTETHPLWPDTKHNFVINGVQYETLEKVCTAAMKLDNPEELVMEALRKLPEYVPNGELVFMIGGEMNKRNYQKTHCYYWTSGMVERAVPLVDREKWPGLNRLAEMWHKICEERSV